MQGNILGKSVGDSVPGSCLSIVAPTVRQFLLLGNIWITICTCISLRKKWNTNLLVIIYHQSYEYISQNIDLKKKKYPYFYESDRRGNRIISVCDPSFQLASGTVYVCAQASCPLKYKGSDALENIDFLQCELSIKETVSAYTIDHLRGQTIATNHHHCDVHLHRLPPTCTVDVCLFKWTVNLKTIHSRCMQMEKRP